MLAEPQRQAFVDAQREVTLTQNLIYIPVFKGRLNASEARVYVNKVRDFITIKNIVDDASKKIVLGIKLADQAATWFNDHRDVDETFDELADKFIRRFTPAGTETRNIQTYLTMKHTSYNRFTV
ncbi:unnamed protein product [Ambrosiozyma monospora]|uniref:Unnamed protein product n=1 Tax=Ambrosiozyma monospora TaxID=43982 RepID=A0A9W6T8I7_AMBMO|nr:unnamed protein product [Ambrosiozyma monospora]